jgi:hypothetical protein
MVQPRAFGFRMSTDSDITGSPKFRTAAVQAIVKLSIAADPPPSPTFAVVFAAIICEHATTLSDSANDILHTISSRLGTFACELSRS